MIIKRFAKYKNLDSGNFVHFFDVYDRGHDVVCTIMIEEEPDGSVMEPIIMTPEESADLVTVYNGIAQSKMQHIYCSENASEPDIQ